MTAKWLLEAAEAAYPIDCATAEDGSEWDVNLASRVAFIAGAELMAEKAAQIAERHQYAGLEGKQMRRVTVAIRSLARLLPP